MRALTYWYNVRRYPTEMGLPPRKPSDELSSRGLAEYKDGFVGAEGGDGEDSLEEFAALHGLKGAFRHPLEEDPDFFLLELDKMDYLDPAAVAFGEEALPSDGGLEAGESSMGLQGGGRMGVAGHGVGESVQVQQQGSGQVSAQMAQAQGGDGAAGGGGGGRWEPPMQTEGW